jgi:hypothetical protein
MFVSNLANAQITFPKNIDPKDVVAQLFETKFNPADSTFNWIPNISESVQFTWEHKKDTLITNIDTVFNYKNFYDNKKIILTYTNTFNNSCHACQPSLGLIGLSLDDENVFSNLSTNEFIALSDDEERFNEICQEMLNTQQKLLN